MVGGMDKSRLDVPEKVALHKDAGAGRTRGWIGPRRSQSCTWNQVSSIRMKRTYEPRELLRSKSYWSAVNGQGGGSECGRGNVHGTRILV
jgi:hypothetical protein